MTRFPKQFMGKTYEQKQIDENKRKCGACSGSGKYDTTIRGRIPDCAACNGTGLKQ